MTTFADAGLHFPLFEAPIADADVGGPGDCSKCGKRARFLFSDACFDCFRQGRAGHTMDTEYGMVRPEDAALGRTHGIPFDPNDLPDLPLVPHSIDPNFPDQNWFSVEFPADDLVELTRTPAYHTWQGEQWLFCCGRPCVFMGCFSLDRLEQLASGLGSNPAMLLARMTSMTQSEAQGVFEGIATGAVSLYVFRCRSCGGHRAHWDMD